MCTDVLAAAENHTCCHLSAERPEPLRVTWGQNCCICTLGACETPICSKQEWHHENRLEGFCPELSFAVRQVLCFNQIAFTRLPEAGFIFRAPKTADWGWESTGGLRDLLKLVCETGDRDREAGSSGVCSSFTMGPIVAERWVDGDHDKCLWAAERGLISVTLARALPWMVVQVV